MNIDSLPLTAFSLEASGAAALAVGRVHTLTLKAHQPAAGAVAAITVQAVAVQGSVTVLADSFAQSITFTL